MDLLKIITSTDRYNFHSHTQFCDGRDTVASIAAAAVASGFEHFGFSPHSPVPIQSPCNMSAESVGAFRAEVNAANEMAHGTTTKFYVGMEIDFLGKEWGPHTAYFTDLNLDYSIGSVHFIRNRRGEYIDIDGKFDSFRSKMADKFDNDIRYVVNEYYRASAEMLSLGGFDILGHMDKIGQNASYYSPGIEDEGWYIDLIEDYIAQVIASGKIVEINTKARVEHGRFFPGERYWKRLVEAGVPLMVNSDAHYADKVDASRCEALSILSRLK